MTKTYSCSFSDCGMIFSKSYELKKHVATHEDPASVFHCPECDFITLQKKNLGIHLAIHTGEKLHKCPDVIISSSSPDHEEQCQYRTNDPAALTKHRKKVHGYTPPPNRRWRAKITPVVPRKPRQKKGNSPLLPQRPVPDASHSLFSGANKANTSDSSTGHPSISTNSLEDPSPSLLQGDGGDSMDAYWLDNSSFLSNVTFVAPPEEDMRLDTLYDPSLHPEWMTQYEMGYSMFNITGMKHLPDPLRVDPPPARPSIGVSTGREGCLCPDWMVEAGIEGWDRSVLDAHRDFYV